MSLILLQGRVCGRSPAPGALAAKLHRVILPRITDKLRNIHKKGGDCEIIHSVSQDLPFNSFQQENEKSRILFDFH